MIIVTLNTLPSPMQTQFFNTTLQQKDALIVTSNTIAMVYHEKPLETLAYVRESELAQCGGVAHESWTTVSDDQWVELLTSASKHIAW